MTANRFATRLNSFASRPQAEWPDLTGKPSLMQMAARAAKVEGLTDLDLNFPDHVGERPAEIARKLGDLGLSINGFAMRYYSNPAFKLGAFTNPDPAVRREAIDLTKAGIDATRETGASLMTLWLGQDGFDYAFQADYATLWQHEIDGIREVATHDPGCQISLEYKPNEPRSYSLMPDAATTLLAIREVGLPNLGVTLDFAHVLYADEQPAFAAALVARHSKLLGVHLNDGYAKRDDGLMVGAVHTLQTIELLRQIRRDGYAGAIYFDTFPDMTGLDPVRECEVNIATVKRMLGVVERLDKDNRLSSAIDRQDAVATQAIVQEIMLGA
ncbi:sugar phosphate isomerase/epimerase family protein [Mesorhizobium carmichaelinearum]|uniref:sugar phosphate isomerase/epimerase family protein n=1 Tax=Mesorhizobium carmichaelinearum TaxID=1208188 RepID=UPI000BA350B0|nr:sugar phosphate isomerase/epimerase family protein [Mesorhizobium carmichaelinearum]